MKLKDKVAVLVGYAGNLDCATAELFAQEGAKVAFVDLSIESGRPFAESLKAKGHDVLYYHMNITDPNDVKSMIECVLDAFGKIDIYVGNAFPQFEQTTVLEISDKDWHKAVDTTLTGQFLCSKYMIPAMTNGGSITFVSSSTAMRTEPESFCRSAIAFGILGLMRSIAADYSQVGIRANAVCPSTCKEDLQNTQADERFANLNLMKRHGTAAEIAKSILYLASDDSSFISGTTLSVDGGLHIF